ncbi:BatA domain-containing protein [Mucilaginibacter pedocola]|uniref:Aerotolerance regulator N-terminal domain-containing protein n=1 Tax=Mucilaginibacter pedocola TaxID=1792845 RepID=A0A1S9PE30_9SPHI|nr:BatA domain-containing protein [Mucilaginibacter pedocola]OOQ59167.1 hypothetical protein BC343_28820 [Mucilaginibacter pedocola]
MLFSNPIWFIALAAIGIPVVIHLWNIRPGKTLKVGSIALITEASKTSSRSFKLLDILLLILRCLLLSLLAFYLAGPLWHYFSPEKKAKGWVLIPKENFRESYGKFKPRVDSLIKAGYEFHEFNKGFAKRDWQKLLADTTLQDTVSNKNYWELVKQLDAALNRGTNAYIITPNLARNFKGDKPFIHLFFRWDSYTPADSVSRWIAGAWMSNIGDIKALVGNSTPMGTSFTTQAVQANGDNGIALNVANGQPAVSLKNSGQASVDVDTTELTIAVYSDKYAVDVGYLKAALEAATNFIGPKASIKQYTAPSQIPAGQKWLFWVSDAPLDRRLIDETSQVFRYEPGKVSDVSTTITPGNFSLAKLINAQPAGEVIWQDGFGGAVLAKEQRGQTSVYHFYSHFNPSWGDMVWSDAFPQQILKLLSGQPYQVPPEYDKRTLSAKQLLPNSAVNSYTPSSVATTSSKDVSPYAWLLLFVVFFAERLLAYKTKTNNG